MAEIIRYVNTASVGGDGTTNATTGANAAYSSLLAWNTAEATDLVTAQNTHIVYCEGAADAIAQNTDINMSAWVTDSNYYVTITVDPANRSTLGKLDTSKYHLYKVGSSSWGDIIKYVKYTKVIGLQFYIRANSGTNATRQCLVPNTTSEIALTAENCIFDCGGNSAAYTGRPWNITAAGPNYFRNNIVIFDSNLFGAQVLSTTQGSGVDNTFIYNNTFIDKNKTAYVFNINNSTNSVWKNNIFQGFLDHFTTGTGGNITGSDYNLTDLPSISYGTNNTVNTRLNFGDSYLLSTADFQVLSEGIGPSLDANVPLVDILGNSRSGDTTSVGALNTLSLNYLKLDSQSYSKTHIPATLIADADLFTVVIDPPPGYAVHNVTDLSQSGSTSSIYYGLSVSIGDQILHRTTTETNGNTVNISSTGIVSTNPSGNDTFKFRHWTPSTWSAELTYTVVAANNYSLTADTGSYSLTGNVVAFPVKKIRYVNTASTAGGTGKTNATTGADRAYSTLQSALSTEQADLVTQNVKLEIYCAGGADTSTPGQYSWPSLVTGPNNDVKIYAAPGNTAEETFNPNKYHLIRSTGGQEVLYITSSDNVYMSFYRLQIKSTLTTHTALRVSTTTSGVTTGKVLVSGCYIEGGTTAYGISFSSRNQPHVVVNSILVSTGGAASNSIASVFYNNTVISYSTGPAASAWAGSTIPYYMRNNIFQNYGGGVALSGTLPTNTSSNITNDATSTEVSLRNITLNFKDKVGKNFRLVSDDYLSIGSGTDLSLDPIYPITVDLLGNIRTFWDIGAVKYTPLISASNRVYTLTHNDANLIHAARLTADTQSYTLTRNDASLLVGRKLVAESYTPVQIWSDDFTGAAGVLGSNYTQQGDALLRLDGLGNVYSTTSSARAIAWTDSISFSNNQYAEITLTEISYLSSAGSGVVLRLQTNESPGVEKSYFFRTGNAGEAYAVAKYNDTSSVVTILNTTIIPKVGDRLKAVAISNNLYFYVNNQLIASVSDNSWSTGVPGIYGFSNGWKSDDFVAGDHGGITVAGTYTNVLASRVLTCDTANYSVQTFEVGNLLSRRLIVTESSFSIVYQEVSVTKSSAKKIEAITQTYSIISSEASLLRGLAIPVTAQAFTLTGPPVATLANRVITAETSAYTRIFNSASIIKISSLSANTGNFELFSFPISTPRTYGLLCSHTAFVITSTPAGILKQSKLTTESRNFDLAEQTTSLKTSRKLTVQSTSLNAVSQQVSLERSFRLFATSQSYTLVRPATTLTFVRKIQATSKTFTLSTSIVVFDRGYVLVTTPSEIAITFPVTGVYANRRIYLTTQTYFVPIRVWDGGAWTPKPLKIWTGTEWQIIL